MTREWMCPECREVYPEDDLQPMRDRDSGVLAVCPLVCEDCAELDRYAPPDSEPDPSDGPNGGPEGTA